MQINEDLATQGILRPTRKRTREIYNSHVSDMWKVIHTGGGQEVYTVRRRDMRRNVYLGA